MKIVLAGGGSGGHFYPLIAIAEAIEDICEERSLLEPDVYYIGPPPFDAVSLHEHDIIYKPGYAGRMRRYASILNILDIFPTIAGIIRATFDLFSLYPDVVFSTGGFASFPTLCAARLLQIPIVIYDADATPGRVSLWSCHFAKYIAVAHADTAALFPANVRSKIAHVGHPIRREIMVPSREGGHEFLKLDPTVQSVFVMGGSLGARALNETVLDALSDLVSRYNVIHQTGTANLEEVAHIASVALRDSAHKDRYRSFGLLNTLAIRMAAGTASVIVSRAGSGSIFEIASWKIPAILVPIPADVSHDQTENAFSYARAGGAIVIEQQNLSPHVLSAEIDRLMQDEGKRAKMIAAAERFSRPDAAKKIATILLETGISHQPV